MSISEAQVDIPSDDGAKITLWQVGAGPPLVLVHDIAEDHTRWRPLYSALGAHFTLYAMDRRGRGASTDGPSYDTYREYEDLSEVLTHLAPGSNLLGLGWGAVLALGAARRVPEGTLGRLVLYEPPVPVDQGPSGVPPIVIERLQGMLAGGDRDRVVALYLTEVGGMNGAELEEQKTLPSWRGRLGAARTIPRELRARNSLRLDTEGLRQLAVPTLLLDGSMSPDPLRKGAAFLHRVLPSSRIATFPGEKHVAMDHAPEMFLREVLGFLMG